MHEIVSVEAVERLFLILALATLPVGALVAWRYRPLIGLIVALIGPVNYALWKLYNGVTNRLGLDTMRNLYVNLAIFAALGFAGGWILTRRTGPEK